MIAHMSTPVFRSAAIFALAQRPCTLQFYGHSWLCFIQHMRDAVALWPCLCKLDNSITWLLPSSKPIESVSFPDMMQVQASSPWPDVIMASQLDCAPRFSDPQRRSPNDFRVEMPQSQLAENSSPHDRFPAMSSGDSLPDGRPQLNLERAADVYRAQKSQPGKASSHE